MTITKNVALEADEKIIDNILEKLQDECESWAGILLGGVDFDFNNRYEYMEYRRKLTEEIFDDVLTKLAFEYNKEG